jgi:hypothetical protein
MISSSKHSWPIRLSVALFLKEHHILCQMKYNINDDTHTSHLNYGRQCLVCRSLGPHSGGYEEYYFLGYNDV